MLGEDPCAWLPALVVPSSCMWPRRMPWLGTSAVLRCSCWDVDGPAGFKGGRDTGMDEARDMALANEALRASSPTLGGCKPSPAPRAVDLRRPFPFNFLCASTNAVYLLRVLSAARSWSLKDTILSSMIQDAANAHTFRKLNIPPSLKMGISVIFLIGLL